MRELARLPLDPAAFRSRYGPWAVIAGASEGTGECYARELASMGINLVLVSRRQAALDTLGEALKAEQGIEYRTLAQDLTADWRGPEDRRGVRRSRRGPLHLECGRGQLRQLFRRQRRSGAPALSG